MDESARRGRAMGRIAEMLKSEFGVDSPREFQLDCIYKLAFLRTTLLCVEKTGGGKSLVVLGATAFLMGIALVIEPLLAVGADQRNSAHKACERWGGSGIIPIHLDELSDEDSEILAKRLNGLKKRRQATVVLWASPQSLKKEIWSGVLDHLFSMGLISLVGVDEAHSVPASRFYRPEFADLEQTLIRKMASSPRPVSFVSMTATFNRRAVEDYKNMLKLLAHGFNFDFIWWGGVDRRDVALSLQVKSKTTPALKSFTKGHLEVNEDRQVIIYTNDAGRAAKNIPDSIDATIATMEGYRGDDVASIHGDMGAVFKAYLARAWGGHETPALKLRALVATKTGEVGLNSQQCGAVANDGVPESKESFMQKLGRAGRRQLAPGEKPFECLTVLSVPSFTFLVSRICHSYSSTADLKRQMDELLGVMKLLLLSTTCIHQQLEADFGNPYGDGQVLPLPPCGSMCWVCSHSGPLHPAVGRVSRANIIRALQVVFLGGKVTATKVVEFVNDSREDIWELPQGAKMEDAHRLVLQLVAAEILDFIAVENSVEKAARSTIYLKWKMATRATQRRASSSYLAFEDDARWCGIAHM